MNLADVTILIAQGTFVVIFVFALGSFVAYKMRGKSTPVYLERVKVQVPYRESPVIIEEDYQISTQIQPHTFGEPSVSALTVGRAEPPKITSKTVKISSTRPAPKPAQLTRYKVVNYTFERQSQRVVDRPDINTNWS
ncbi:MAG: hypothetical protein LCH52_09920 [Bacteroidetes bacterium]|nr:hypothetical protein [Bacteroidota bacterium]